MRRMLAVLVCLGMLFASCSSEAHASSFGDTASTVFLPPPTEDGGGSWEYTDTFEEFMMFPQGRGYFYGKKKLEKNEVRGMPFVVFRVVGIAEESTEFTVYTVQVDRIYGAKEGGAGELYRMVWRGRADAQLYGRPPLESGVLYGRFLGISEDRLHSMALWQAGLIYRVEEENGKRYLYGYGVDLSSLDCRIPIVDPEENSIYKTGKHEKALAKLRDLGQAAPVFEYKAELDAFLREIG